MADRPRMLFNAFTMFTPSHHAQGLWAEPDSRQLEYNDPRMWIDLAQLCERGLFDTLFFADVLAPYDLYQDSRDAAVHEGMQFPTGDPSVLIPLLAHHTEHLGFTFTQNILQEQPYPFARKMSTLDHLTGGRVAWNIVTTFLPGAGRNLGHGGLPDHAERYARAEDFTQAVYKLWEHSWEDAAVVRDRVPLGSLLRGDSPRLVGESSEHAQTLAESEGVLPPIVAQRSTMRVVDGMHRLQAAALRGESEILVQFYDGDDERRSILAVEANITHGLPLSLADRTAAAARIVAARPDPAAAGVRLPAFRLGTARGRGVRSGLAVSSLEVLAA